MIDRPERAWVVLDIHRSGYSATHMHFGDRDLFKQKKKPNCFRYFLNRQQAVQMMSELTRTSKQVGWMIADA